MDKQSFFNNIRQLLGRIAWRVFLWSIKMTQEEYIAEILRENHDGDYGW